MEDLIKQISERKAKLEETKASLKSHFIGLDAQIDHVINMLQTWYVMPELITRPVIINIWGMTGTGKTDLIRRLARELQMLNKFFELQMDTKKNNWVNSIEESFYMAGIEENEPAIVLFDEMQRFRTKGKDGDQIDNDMYQDIWMLLSDGTFANNAGKMGQIQELLFEQMYNKEREEHAKREKASEAEDAKKKIAKGDVTPEIKEKAKTSPEYKFKTSYWNSKRLKKRLKLDEPVEEIMTWTTERKINTINDRAHDDSVNKGADYNKLLIFICGNLDEAYSMAREADEADIDADVFHEFSKKINLINVKGALGWRFQPEQIARLGNNHVIYPAMSKCNYEELIRRNIDKAAANFEETSKIKLDIDDSVIHAIYRNGVFPTQGVRPVFTTISSIFESNMPDILVYAMENGSHYVKISFESNPDELVGTIKCGKTFRKAVKCDIDATKKSKNLDKMTKTAVHEAGHAVLYTLLFKLIPTQLVASSSSIRRGGFMLSHQTGTDKKTLQANIAICYGGQVAETMVFGTELTTGGCSQDVAIATERAVAMVRDYEMDGLIGKVSDLKANTASAFVTKIAESNAPIEMILTEQKKRATELLQKHAQYHLALTKALIAAPNNKLEQSIIFEIAQAHSIDAELHDSSYEITPTYTGIFDEYGQKLKEV